MTERLGEAVLDLRADSSRLQSDLRSAEGHVKRSGGIMQTALGVAGGALIIGGLAGVAGQFGSIISNATEAQRIMTQTNAVLASTRGISGMTAASVGSLADQLAKIVPVDDEVIQATENMLLTFTNIRDDVFPGATEAALDMSIALGEDAVSSAMRLGKALNDPIGGVTALRRVGVQLTDAQEEQIKSFVAVGDVASAQKVILGELTTEFGGSARAAGQTFGGQMTILKTKIDNVKESIGLALLPLLTRFVGMLSSALPAGVEKVKRLFTALTAENGVLNILATRFARALGVPRGSAQLIGFANTLRAVLERLLVHVTGLAERAVVLARVIGQDLAFALRIAWEAAQLLADAIGLLVRVVENIPGMDQLISLLGTLGMKSGQSTGEVNLVTRALGLFIALVGGVFALRALTSFATGVLGIANTFILFPFRAASTALTSVQGFVTAAAGLVSKAVTITQTIVTQGAELIRSLPWITQEITQLIKRTGAKAITDFGAKVQTIRQNVIVTKAEIAPGVIRDFSEKLALGLASGIGAALGATLGPTVLASIGAALSGVTAAGIAAILVPVALIITAVVASFLAGFFLVRYYREILSGLQTFFEDVGFVVGAAAGLVVGGIGLIAVGVKRGLTEHVFPPVATFFSETVPLFLTETLPLWGTAVLQGIRDALGNVGPGLGPIIGPTGTYAPLPDGAIWVLSIAMLLGRLELLTVLVLFSPVYWRG